MARRKIGKHDSLCTLIANNLIERGYYPVKNRVYALGEVDVYTKKDKYVLLFEAKSTKTKKSNTKALDQLDRAKRYLFNNYRVFPFLVYFEDDKPVYEWKK